MTGGDVSRVIAFLTGRLGVFRTWGSFGRVAAWVVVWVVVIGAVLGAVTPGAGREYVPDFVEGNRVVYLGPLSKQDHTGFVRPPTAGDDDVFHVAWVGGSEVKFDVVSVPAVVSHQFTTFGGRPVEHDVYTLVAPRTIDALRMIESALDGDPDAVVVSISPAWATDEFELRAWPNLDVANVGTLWRRPGLWAWAAALTSPADVGWRLTRAWSRAVAAQSERNPDLQDVVDALDVLERPPAEASQTIVEQPEGDPRLPPGSAEFWLMEELGPDVFVSPTERQATMLDGFRDEHPVARDLATRLVDTLADADVPVYVYLPPFSPDARADPHFAAAFADLVAFWQAIAEEVDDPQVHISVADLGAQMDPDDHFNDVIHQYDAYPLAVVLAPQLCAWWSDQLGGECS